MSSHLQVHTPQGSYPVHIGATLSSLNSHLKAAIAGRQVMIVTQAAIARHYLEPLQSLLSDYECQVFTLPEGEAHKNLANWQALLEKLMEAGYERSATLIALGGGMVGDLCGFAAATYLRGVNYIQMPTTLMAQVDSCLGGKTGVNHESGKNLIGAFYQPRAVLVALETLKTLDSREYRAGLAEIIKYALIRDAAFFSFLEQALPDLLGGDTEALKTAVSRCLALKAEIVSLDPYEQKGQRALLNYGHTLGHALEKLCGYGHLRHGEALAIGMLYAARLSCARGRLSIPDYQRLLTLLERTGLPLEIPKGLSWKEIQASLFKDKKVDQGRLRFVLLAGIGEAYLEADLQEEELLKQIPHG